MLTRVLLPVAATLGAIAVLLGAFGAHGLESRLSPSSLKTWATAVDYQFIHVLVLLILGFIRPNLKQAKWIDYAALFIFLGIVLFSGSLYLLALTQIKLFAYLTPVGGLCFILGWLCIAIHGFIKS
ncbi:MAG: DUF423 domain-containing protein [Gammaproteobacteria bacterium]|nr:DUF423 domain-containing protein [Gammaproteobacteria bacterium]